MQLNGLKSRLVIAGDLSHVIGTTCLSCASPATHWWYWGSHRIVVTECAAHSLAREGQPDMNIFDIYPQPKAITLQVIVRNK